MELRNWVGSEFGIGLVRKRMYSLTEKPVHRFSSSIPEKIPDYIAGIIFCQISGCFGYHIDVQTRKKKEERTTALLFPRQPCPSIHHQCSKCVASYRNGQRTL